MYLRLEESDPREEGGTKAAAAPARRPYRLKRRPEERVQVLGDMPAGERPQVRVVDTKSAWFKTEAERIRAAKGADFSPCDIDIPVEVK